MWREQAACAGQTPLWFSKAFQLDAATICQRCPVLAECEEWSLTDECDDMYGVVAGMLPAERRQRKEVNGEQRQKVVRAAGS